MSTRPTDAAIVKGFENFEKGFNVIIAHLATLPDDDEAHLHYAHEIDALWMAHRFYRETAIAAQARIDARKAGKK